MTDVMRIDRREFLKRLGGGVVILVSLPYAGAAD